MKEELLKRLNELIEKANESQCYLPEGETAYDYSGGNFDDAYSAGHDHGFNSGKKHTLKKILKIVEDTNE